MLNNFRPLSWLWLGLISVSLIAGCSSGSGSGSGGGGGSTTPAPALASISPTSAPAGESSVTLTASGSNFTSASQIEVAGIPAVTSFVSSSQLTATVTASQLANAASIPVAVVTAGQITSSVTFTVDNPAPSIVSLSPTSVAAGSTAANVTITGTGFVSGSAGSVNGSARPTALLSSTQLVVTLGATDLAAVGTVPVLVTNPTPGGGSSTASNVSVAATAANSPTLRAVLPSPVYVGSPDTTLALTGTNFNSACSVQINGKPVPSADLGSTLISTTAAASLLTSAGSLPVTVTCLGITSNAVTVSVVNPPVPTLTSGLQAIPLNTQTTFAATGTGFTQNTVLQLNGVTLATTYKSSTTLNAVIPSSAVTGFGNYSITAFTPAPGGGTSAAIAVTPFLALPNNSMVYNPAAGLFYLSVPSSAGAPYGNSVVSVDPVSGAIGAPIFVGSEPDRLALSSDGSVLWVGLDGGASVRKVNLATRTASYTFTLGGNAGVYDNPGKALALAAIPGSPDSVAVAAFRAGSFNNSLQVFDSGVPRTTSFSNYVNNPEALQIDGTRGEIYAGANNSYYVFNYSSSGLTTKTTVSSGSYGSNSNDDLQNANGRLYTDFGKVYDTESGSLLGTLYSSGTTVATGPTVADTTLNKIFVLDSSTQSIYDQNKIQIFDLNAYTTSSNAISISSNGTVGSHLTRWGANGLAFRTSTGFFSLRSNFVNDLSSTNADLGVALAATPSSTTTGSTVTYAITTTNAGPSASTGVALSYALPSNGVVTAITPSQGTCNTSGSCDLGSLSSSASATVTFSVQMLTSGTATLTANVTGSENDPTAINNSASLSVTVTGAAYSLAPSIASLSPAAIQAGLSTDTTVTINGTNFTPNSIAILGTTALATTYVSPTQLTVVVPQATSASLGWAPVSVSTPAPGGGSTSDLPLSFFQVLTAGINHILYDPFSRKIMAAVGSGSSTLTGNSIVALTPETGTFGTPVPIGSQPSNLALSDDGSLLYTILTGAESVARFNMLSQSVDFTFAVPAPQSSISPALRDLAVEPGSPNTVVLDLGSGTGIAAYDFNPSTQTAAIRGQATGPYTGSSLQFLDSANLFDFDVDTSGSTFNHFTLTSSGFTYYNYGQYTESTLNNFGRFKIRGNLAFANNGGVADPTVTPAQQLGVYPPAGTYAYNQIVEPDTSLSRVFFLGETSSSNTSGNPDGIITYNQQTFLPLAATSLNMSAIEGSGTSYSGVDLIRWGQDGLAVLSSAGHIYLLRGGAVVPAELTSNSAATLSTLSTNTIAVGTGNTTISVTGVNFIPGAALFWNGSYRTTTFVDSSHLTAFIPASDLASAGTASITVNNPSASASNILSITIQ